MQHLLRAASLLGPVGPLCLLGVPDSLSSGLFVAPQAADNSAGEAAFVDSAGFSSGFALGGYSGPLGGVVLAAGLGDRTDAVRRTQWMRRWPPKSSRCLVG